MTPKLRNAKVFSAALLLGTVLGAAQANTALVDAAAYPEGPLWHDGKLLFVEYAGPGISTAALPDSSRIGAIIYWSRATTRTPSLSSITPANKSAASTGTAPVSLSLDPMISPRMAAAEFMYPPRASTT